MKTYHMAGKIKENGDVSALCFAKPRAIDLTRASWTIRQEEVTCKRCIEIMPQIITHNPAKPFICHKHG